MTSQNADCVEFVELTAHPDFEISTGMPFIIRRKKDGKIMKFSQKHNKQSSEFLDSLDGLNVVQLTEYHNVKFDRYYYDRDNEKLYLKTRAKKNKDGTPQFHYKLIKPCFHNNLDIITLLPVSGGSKLWGYNKFIKHCKTL